MPIPVVPNPNRPSILKFPNPLFLKIPSAVSCFRHGRKSTENVARDGRGGGGRKGERGEGEGGCKEDQTERQAAHQDSQRRSKVTLVQKIRILIDALASLALALIFVSDWREYLSDQSGRVILILQKLKF